MSMLADRKTKQKWSLNPRGKAWSEDSSKFGQKLLEKMGWSHGKGLGPKEDGIVEHVKVSYKNDSKGMGYKESDDQWTKHDSNFNALLQSLSGQEEVKNDLKLSSLEKKSEKSKVRVHYKKYTRGKDLSRCSEKDLANIFGKKSLKEAPLKMEEIEDTKDSSRDGFSQNRGSMVDYFKKKIPNFGKINGYAIGNNGVLKKDTDSEEESYVGFGFKRKSDGDISNGTPKKIKCDEDQGLSNPAFDPLFGKVQVQKHVLNTIKEEDNQEEDRERNAENFEPKKKKIQKNKEDANSTINSDFQNSFGHINEDLEVKKKKKKKSKENIAIDNPNFQDGDLQDSYINEDFEVPRKKKKKNKERTNEDLEVKRKIQGKEKVSLAIDNPNFEDNNCQDSYINEDFEVKRKKKRKNKDDSLQSQSGEVKRKIQKEENSNMAIDNPNFEDNDDQNSYVNEDFEVKRKIKGKENVSLAVDNPNFGDNNCQDSYTNEDFEVKRKKKKNKEDSLQSQNGEVKKKIQKEENSNLAIDNPNFEDNDDQNSYANEDFEVPRKKKKKNKENTALDNPNFEDSCVNEDFEVKNKKKKKKSKTNDSLALDNPNFNNSVTIDNSVNSEAGSKLEKSEENSSNLEATSNSELNFDLILNVTSTPSVPKEISKSSMKRRKSVRFSKVTEERIIPNNEMIVNGLNEDGTSNLEEISKKIDGFQAEIENDINEAKAIKYIGDVGNPDGDNEKLPEGTKLKFKYAKFGKSPIWVRKSPTSKSSYKHLIKGDIVLGFKNTNLHEIKGYGVKNDS